MCNVRGISDVHKRRQVFNFFRQSKADIIFLQETHSTKRHMKFWRNLWGGEIYFNHGDSNARGVCILMSKKLNFQVKKIIKSHDGRCLTVEGTFDDKTVSLTNIYAPNKDEPEFFREILTQVYESSSEFKVIGGDLNVLLNPKLDRRGGSKVVKSKSAHVINEFLEENSWADIWRVMHDNLFQFTWKKRQPVTLSRLDYFLAPGDVLNATTKCIISSCPFSDHSCVNLEVTFDHEIKGRGFWKFNTALLHDKPFVEEINNVINKAENRYRNYDDGLKWEMLKMDCTEISQYYSHIRASDRKIEKGQLMKRLRTQEKRLCCINMNVQNSLNLIEKINVKIDSIKIDLNKITSFEAKGAALRAKSKWYKCGDVPTKYFLNLEKTRAKTKVMKAVFTDNGQMVTRPKEVLKEQCNFYKKLYTVDDNIQFHFNKTIDKKLSKEEKDEIEGDLTIDELSLALKTTSQNKSPGPDGIPTDFYQFFWSRIKHFMLAAFNYAYKVSKSYLARC